MVKGLLTKVVNDPAAITALLEFIDERHKRAHQNAILTALEFTRGKASALTESLLAQGAAEALSDLYKMLDAERKVAK